MPGDERLSQNAPITALVAAACRARGIPLYHGSSTAVNADDTPYAASKRASEEAAAGATMLRFHYPYGPGQRRGAIPTMLRQALAGEQVVVYRGWERSFCFAGDAAAAVLLIVERSARRRVGGGAGRRPAAARRRRAARLRGRGRRPRPDPRWSNRPPAPRRCSMPSTRPRCARSAGSRRSSSRTGCSRRSAG